MKKNIITSIAILILLLGLFVHDALRFFDGKLHVVFCNVGQGDAIFVRTPRGSNILIDGGPNDLVLGCLDSHTPFWSRKVSLVLLTHPHVDHFLGLIAVLKRYTVLAFSTEELFNSTASFKELLSLIKQRGLNPRFLYPESRFKTLDGVTVKILGPTKEFLQKTSPGGQIGESKEFASLETLITYGNFSVLLTGDSQIAELQEAMGSDLISKDGVKILQVPHHGSKTGLSSDLLQELNPKIAVISVGKNNYGHPSPETLKILSNEEIKILRTDEDGDIEIVSDGERWGLPRGAKRRGE